jgi:hypothetical protein
MRTCYETGDRASCHDGPCIEQKTWFLLDARRERGGARQCAQAALERNNSCFEVAPCGMDN